MRTSVYLLIGLLSMGPLALSAQGQDLQEAEADPLGMWECPQEGQPPLYTNRERSGCRKMELKPLSTVPSLPESPSRLQRTHPSGPSFDHPNHMETAPPAHSRNVPDWGKDWYAKNSSDASVQSEVCSLYSEWLQLIQRTRGGFYFGSDPSYGADPSGRNFSSTNGFWDNARYVTLANIFGRGFVPIGCL